MKCPTCGYTYKKEEAPNKEGISIKHNKQQTKIVTAKRNKKYYDKQGNLITDPDLIAEVRKGNTVISYNEIKSGEDVTIDTRNRRIIRTRK